MASDDDDEHALLTDAIAELGLDHRKRPLVNLLSADGKLAARFRHTLIAVPDVADDDSREAAEVYAVLVNGRGEVLYQEDGEPAIVKSIPMTMVAEHDADALIPEDQVVAWTTLSPSTLDRQVRDGTFPKPVFLSARRKAWRWGDLKTWVQAQPRSLHDRLYGLDKVREAMKLAAKTKAAAPPSSVVLEPVAVLRSKPN